MTRLCTLARNNAIAILALFIAVGGTSYAALGIPAGSVGNRQLRNHSISPNKFQRSSIAGYVRDWAQIDAAGKVTASRPRAHIVNWVDGGLIPGGIVSWGQPIPSRASHSRPLAWHRPRRRHMQARASLAQVTGTAASSGLRCGCRRHRRPSASP